MACTRMPLGKRGATGAHSDERRARFDELWRNDESHEAAFCPSGVGLRRVIEPTPLAWQENLVAAVAALGTMPQR